jgi:hypothetical protein
MNGPTADGTYDVRGATATYWHKSYITGDEESALSWSEGRRGFVLRSRGACFGDIPTSVDTMVQFARSLVVP